MNIRLSLEAEFFLQKHPELKEKIKNIGKLFITRKDLEELLPKEKNKENKIKVIRYSSKPIASEYDPDIKLVHTKDVTGKSRSTGSVEDFVDYFRNRFERTKRLFYSSKYPRVDLKYIKEEVGSNVSIIAMVYEKRETKNGNLLLEVEDLTGIFKVIISKKNEKVYEKARKILKDEVLMFHGKVLEPFLIVEDFEWPDIPITKEKKYSEKDLAIAYLSDLHFGSSYFNKKLFNKFKDWLNLKTNSKIAEKVKYLVIAGDVADGIGIYPGQENQLEYKDIFKQYELFDKFIEEIPDYISVIIIPGNHDAVRRGEPSPSIPKDFIRSEVISLGNPTNVIIEGFKHVIYHGTSLDGIIASVPGTSYEEPEKAMKEYLIRRNLSPLYGSNLIIPEKIDYMVIDEVPDVIHCGHIHKNGYMVYRGVHIVNSGTFQNKTDFQERMGHNPTPGRIGILELKPNKYSTIDFNVI